MKWSKEADSAIGKVPFFVRKKVKRRVEEEAARRGDAVVTLHHVQTCQSQFLNRMEEEVKGYQLETCFGPLGCPNRAVSSSGLPQRVEALLESRQLRSFLERRVPGALKMHHEFRVSCSDCPNACSRPQIADIGLVGACRPRLTDEDCTECGACVETCKEAAVGLRGGRPHIDLEKCLDCGQCIAECPTGTLAEGEKGFRVLVGGKLGRHPRLATELGGIRDEGAAIRTVGLCLDHYQRHCREGERFGEVIERDGSGTLEEIPEGNPHRHS